MITHIYIKHHKHKTKHVLALLLINRNHTYCIITYLNSPPKQSILLRCIAHMLPYTSKDLIILISTKIHLTLLPIFNYKPKLGHIITKEERAISELHKKYLNKGMFKIRIYPKIKESDNIYVHAIDDICKRAAKFKEINTTREGEIYTYHLPIK